MNAPSLIDIHAALDHGLWLRNQVCSGEGRMLADLAWAYREMRDMKASADKVCEDALAKRNQAEADRDIAREELEHVHNQLKASDVLRVQVCDQLVSANEASAYWKTQWEGQTKRLDNLLNTVTTAPENFSQIGHE